MPAESDSKFALILAKLEAKEARDELLIAGIQERLQHQDTRWQEIKTLLNGGGDSSKSLLMRLDRLEQSEKRRDWMVKSAVGAAIVAVVSAMFAVIPKLVMLQYQPMPMQAPAADVSTRR